MKIALGICANAFAFGLQITGVMPVLNMISEKYSQYSTGTIQLLQTIPYALLIAGSLSIGWLTTKVSKKKLVMAGLAIVGLTGTIPCLVEGFAVLMLCRILIGFGFAISAPLNSAIISDFFEPDKRAGYMGLHVVAMGIGTMIANMLGGILAKSGLRLYFLIYLAGFAGCLIVGLMLPETPPVQASSASDLKLNSMVYSISLMSFAHTLFINAYSTNISLYISEKITQDPSAAGMAATINAACAMCMGILFAKLTGILKNKTLPFSIFCAAAGYAVMLLVPGMPGVIITSALCGVSLSCFSAIGAFLISVAVKNEAVAKANGVYTIIGAIGGLIAPMVLNAGASLLGANTPTNQFVVGMGGMALLGAAASLYIRKNAAAA
ncbi:MAG: MFS transporter [Blautia sp.]|nr:MFS transporter [Blautia sp.]